MFKRNSSGGAFLIKTANHWLNIVKSFTDHDKRKKNNRGGGENTGFVSLFNDAPLALIKKKAIHIVLAITKPLKKEKCKRARGMRRNEVI